MALPTVLYVGTKYDYRDPRRGFSFEHYNLYDTLVQLGLDVHYFDTGSMLAEFGRDQMNARLLELVRAEGPQLMFTVLYRDELIPEVLDQISLQTDTLTLNWFCDDHWRFETYSKFWAPHFNWVITTDRSAVDKYRANGYAHAIYSQWACNHFRYRKLDLPLVYDVTFVGMAHGNRRQFVQVLRDQGIDVLAWGSGWPAGRVKQEDMIRIFNQSRINLNLSNASVPASIVARATALLLRGLVAAPLNNRLRRRLAMPLLNWRTHPEQIKGRNFEVPGCGGFMLTGEVEGLAEYYTPNTEVASYSTVADLVRRVRCYLVEDDLRSAVAKAGYDRTLREHTYEQRFARIFEQIGLAWPQRSGGGAVVDPPRTCTSSNDLLDRDWSG